GDLVKCQEGPHGSDIDNPAIFPLDHVRPEYLTRPQRSREVRVENTTPVFLRIVHGWRALRDASRIDQYVNFPEGIEAFLEQFFERCSIADITGNSQGFLSGGFNFISKRSHELHAPCTRYYVRSSLG